MQPKAADDLRRLVTDGLVERGLTYAHAAAFATPRRLALAVEGLAEPRRRSARSARARASTPPRRRSRASCAPPASPATQLETRADKKARVWFAVTTRPGRPAAEIVAETVEAVVRDFPWPKSMRWGDGSLRWVRPLHSILCILTRETGTEVVPLRDRRHRRRQPHPRPPLPRPRAVPGHLLRGLRAKLARAFVILDPAERAARIAHDAAQLAFARGLELVDDPGLLAENAGLTEWPVTLLGGIDPRFLDLPPEVLQTSMRANQKFFSLRDPASARITAYVLVANRDTADDGATIRAGNARVLAARLADAEFFWQNDLRTPLERWRRSSPTSPSTASSAPRPSASPASPPSPARSPPPSAPTPTSPNAPRSSPRPTSPARWSTSSPSSRAPWAATTPSAPARPRRRRRRRGALRPLGPSDAVPTAPVSVAVALADKLDTLTGFWAIDEKPTGSKDPFALRRAASASVDNNS